MTNPLPPSSGETDGPATQQFATDSAKGTALLNLLRAQQRECWQRGDQVLAEHYLERYGDLAADVELALDLVYSEFLLRESLGEQPTLAEYQRRFPQFAERLARQVELHLALDEPSQLAPGGTPPPKSSISPVAAFPKVAPASGSATDMVSIISQCRLLEPQQLSELSNIAPPEKVEPKALGDVLLQRGWLTRFQVDRLLSGHGSELALGQYVLLELLGEGGMGQVFKARHRLMQRIVALKVIRKEQLGDSDAIHRFHREIRAAAQLSHPHIVLAHDADQVGDTHFFVMEYVEGVDLAKLVQCRGPLPVGEACDCIRQAALGLGHAHERGLIHRDIKPSNLLLTAQEGQVKILDMGLAQRRGTPEADKSAALTMSGTIMGTPDYISPEQATDSHNVDSRCDIYSLGCSLYFLLTGRPPFPTGSALEKLIMHKAEPPTPVEQQRKDVPRGVSAVLNKMMAKKAHERYTTAGEVAVALAPFCKAVEPAAKWVPGAGGKHDGPESGTPWVDGRGALSEPAHHSPFDPARLAASERRRSRSFLRVLALAPLAVVLGVLAAWLPSHLGNSTPDTGEAAVIAATTETQLPTTQGGKPASVIAPSSTRPVPTGPVAVTPPKKDPPEKEKPVEPVDMVQRFDAGVPVKCVTFNPRPGAQQALACGDYAILRWDLKTQKLQPALDISRETDQLVWSVAISRDGKYAVCGTGGMLKKDIRPGDDPEQFSDNFVLLLDLSGSRVVGRFRRLLGMTDRSHDDRVVSVAFSSDGQQVVSGSYDKLVRIWNVTSQREVCTLPQHPDRVLCVAFPPNSRDVVASGSREGGVRVWDVAKRKLIHQLAGFKQPVYSVAFSPDGRRLAAAGADHVVRIWNLDDEQEIGVFKGHDATVRSVVFVDDERLLSGGDDGAMRLWSANHFREIKPFQRHTKPVYSVAVSSDGKQALSGSEDTTVILWNLPAANP